MDLGSKPNRTLDKRSREFADIVDFKRFDTMVVDGRNHVVCDRNRFGCNTTLVA